MRKNHKKDFSKGASNFVPSVPFCANKYRPSKAFSLIEVLVALAIFAITVATLSQAVYNALNGLHVIKSDAHREQLYRFALRQILLIEDRDEMEDGDSIETPEDGPVDWNAEIEETDILDLFELRVEMTLDGDGMSLGGNPGRVETLYVFRPEWSESAERSTLKQDKIEALRDSRRDRAFE